MRRQRGGIKGSIHKYLEKSSITTSRKRTFSLYLAMDDISAKSESNCSNGHDTTTLGLLNFRWVGFCKL